MDATAPSDLRLYTAGFWLPVGRSNFFDADLDGVLVESYNAYDESRDGSLVGHVPAALEIGHPKLQTSVYRRLITVLPSNLRTTGSQAPGPSRMRYSRAYPMFKEMPQRLSSSDGPGHSMLDSDPDAVVLVCQDFAGEEWTNVRAYLEGLVLLVLADGFYVWLALYHGARDANNDDLRKDAVRTAVNRHIYWLVGGPVWNRAGHRAEGERAAPEPPAGAVTLETYRDHHLGMLSFFQINLIFEGMHNDSLDPRIFFDNGEHPERAFGWRQSYSLGDFIQRVTTEALRAPQGAVPAISQVHALLHLPENLSAQQYFDFFAELRKSVVPSDVRADILRQFLRRTSTDTLHMLKWRIESCSRALVSSMIKIAHLRQPLTQTEVPRSTTPDNPTQARYTIGSANEGQLRGYVILLAAKLPLIENVWHYLRSNLDKFDDLPGGANARRSISGLERSWKALLESIKDNIDGLEQAIDQAYKDQMLAETEKLRAEEETLAEIERIRERSGNSLSPANSLTVNVIANLIAVAALLAALVLAGPKLEGFGSLLTAITTQGPAAIAVATLVALLAIVVGVTLLYFVLHQLTEPLIRFFFKVQQRRRRREELYYFEMDLRLDATMSPDVGESLLGSGFTTALAAARADSPPRKGRHRLPHVDRWRFLVLERLWPRAPERNSYRVNRTSQDEAIHKVYVSAVIYWPGRVPLLRRLFARIRMRVFLAYEVLYHNPSGKPRYGFRTLRLVSTSEKILSPSELDELKSLVVAEFVNRWIPGKQEQLSPLDALLSLPAHVPLSQKGQD